MRFYREKILLALLELLPEAVTTLQLQKLMFLLCDRQTHRSYDFMPYLYGCYSMQLSHDLRKLENEGYLNIESTGADKQIRIARHDMRMISALEDEDQTTVRKVVKNFSGMGYVDLIRYTYTNYPFFAINSTIASEYLAKDELKIIEKLRPNISERVLYTIGYEGLSVEKYFVNLIKNGVAVLCDVRKNAYSHKFGFSKSTLQKICQSTGIIYVHLPELGIESDKRRVLNTQEDYDSLFDDYASSVLIAEKNALNTIYLLLQKHGRVALTCFEHNPMQCHRSRIADKLISTSKCNYSLKNL